MANSGPPLSPGAVPPSSGVVGTCNLNAFGLFGERGLRNCELKNGWGVFVSGIGPYKPSELVATLRRSSEIVRVTSAGGGLSVFGAGRQTTATCDEPVPWRPYPTMVMVVPTVGKPGCPGCNVNSFTDCTFVTGCAREMTAMSFSNPPGGTKFGFRTKLLIATPGPAMGANDMVGVLFGEKQWAAVRIVRELISEPVHPEPPALNRLTTLGNWLPAS